MVKAYRTAAALTMGLLFFVVGASPLHGKDIKIVVPGPPAQQAQADSILKADKQPASPEERESIFPSKSLSLSLSHFTWGAEVGSSLDMTAHDLSTFDIDVVLGYKSSIFNLAGVGVGIHRSIHTGNNFIPLYAVLRTDFRKQSSPLFLNLQGGYSFNTVEDSGTTGDVYGAIGLGVNLSRSRMANSYVILSLAYQHFSEDTLSKITIDTHHILFAKIVIGVTF